MATYVVHPNVVLGIEVIIQDFVIVGLNPSDESLETRIGDHSMLRSGTIIYAGNVIGEHFSTGHHALIRECNVIGSNVSIGSCSIIEHHVTIEDDVRLHSSVFVPEFSVLKRGVWLGPHVVLTNARYPRSKNVKKNLLGPVIEEFAKIGANTTVLPGITIGKNALIGAGSVVTKNIPANAVAVGNPARIIKSISELRDSETGELLY